MKRLLLSLTLAATWCVAKGQDNLSISTDFLTQVNVGISESQIPNYLVQLIYESPVEKSLTSEAILALYRANETSLNDTRNILNLLDITPSRMFSINGLNYTMELFNWTFTNFYNTLIANMNLAGQPGLRNALVVLEIDSGSLSDGLLYGEPDPWTTFIQGNFSQVNLELACTAANITLESLWQETRNIFLGNLTDYQVTDFVQLLLTHSIGQSQALTIWHAVPVTTEHVYSLPLFNEVISNFTSRLNSQTTLGVLVSSQEVIINRLSHNIFNDSREFLDVWATTLLARTRLNIGIINNTAYHKLVVLRHDVETPFTNLTTINITTVNANLTNCSYVTFQNNNIQIVSVPSATFNDETYLIPRDVITNVVTGSALICNNTLFGLVRQAEGDFIIVDAFSDYVSPEESSATALYGQKIIIYGCFVFVLLVVSKSVML